jgi:hypothetical protein
MKFSCQKLHRDIDILYKGNVPSFQFKMRPDWSTSTREVDGLSLILIDLYVPALTPRLYCSEATLRTYLSLQSVAYIHVSSAKRAKWTSGVLGGVIYVQVV